MHKQEDSKGLFRGFFLRIAYWGASMSFVQTLLERLHKIVLKGMNIGTGGRVGTSGELFVLRYIRQQPTYGKKFVCFDVGANKGEYAEAVSQIFSQKEVEVFCFEPSSSAFLSLEKRLCNHSRFRLINKALGAKHGTQSLFSDTPGSGLGSLYERRLEHVATSFQCKELIRVCSLDSFCEENNIGFIDLLKMDVEGHEYEVLRGAEKMLAHRKIRYIQFEFGGCNIDSRVFFQDFFYLLRQNYKLFRILPKGLHPIMSYAEEEERFLTTNFLAELCGDV